MQIDLQKIEELDLELLRKWRMSSEITRYMKTDPVITEKQQREWYRKISNDENSYYWIIKVDGVKIGFFSITNINKSNKSCEVGHYIGDKNYLRRGIMKIVESNMYDFIFWNIRLERVIFTIFNENRAAYRLHKSLGAMEVENENKFWIKNNKAYGIVTLCMTKDLWKDVKEYITYPTINIE